MDMNFIDIFQKNLHEKELWYVKQAYDSTCMSIVVFFNLPPQLSSYE